tara:strand:- start:449 stop:616 length:168 start_codon:yes stop_codon:yes gene_type:complete
MGMKKDAKSAYRDAKKFAKKHPFVSLLLTGAAAYTAANIYFTSYVMTSVFEKVNQ